MRNRLLVRPLVVVLVAVCGLTLVMSGPALAGDDEAQKVKKIKKVKSKKMAECEGEECEESRHHRVVIKKRGDGEEIHLECDGEEECEEQMRILLGDDGDVMEIHPSGHHQVIWDSDECEGEECEQERLIVIRKGDGAHHMIHGSGDFTWFGDVDGPHHVEWFDAGKGGFLGIQLTELTSELRAHFGVPGDHGVMVGKVVAESAAETAGVLVGDIVTLVNGEPVASAGELSHAIRSREPGEAVDLGIWRDGYTENLTAVLGEHQVRAHHGKRKMIKVCREGADECDIALAHLGTEFDCAGAAKCKIRVECEGEECTCTANGESIDCAELDLPHQRHGE